MSSHWDHIGRLIVEHDELKPYALENGKPLRHAIGETVSYTNDYGVSFCYQITGFFEPTTDAGLYAAGYRYLVNSDSHWMPITETSLSVASDQLKKMANCY
jgi:hypothetical protein